MSSNIISMHCRKWMKSLVGTLASIQRLAPSWSCLLVSCEGGMRATDFLCKCRRNAKHLALLNLPTWMQDHPLGVQLCQVSSLNTHVTYPLYQESCLGIKKLQTRFSPHLSWWNTNGSSGTTKAVMFQRAVC